MSTRDPRRDLGEIFDAAVRSVDPYVLVKKHLSLQKRVLTARGEAGGSSYARSFDLEGFDRVLVAGAGKASGNMAKALEEILGDRITGGCVAVKEALRGAANAHGGGTGGETGGGTGDGPPARVRLVQAGHPVPDGNSVRAAHEIMKMASGLSKEALERTLLVVLLSGGGSSLLVSPLRWDGSAPTSSAAAVDTRPQTAGSETRGLTLSDIRQTTDALLASGAPIQAVNCVRKHLSGITGGRLARLFHPATVLVLVLSDVVGDRLDTIASGPTAPDGTTFGDALDALRRYDVEDKVPAGVLEALRAGNEGRIEETPKEGDPAFARVHNVIIGSNRIALAAAERKASDLGYNTLRLSSRITGEAREAAKALFGIALEAATRGAFPPAPVELPACILWGGETTVTVRGRGKGGRNQELALSFLVEMQQREGRGEGIWILSASTDGIDGPTDAAGAFASPVVLEKSRGLGLDPARFLEDNDSYTFFDKTGFLYKTGPTGTNVCDLQIALVP